MKNKRRKVQTNRFPANIQPPTKINIRQVAGILCHSAAIEISRISLAQQGIKKESIFLIALYLLNGKKWQ